MQRQGPQGWSQDRCRDGTSEMISEQMQGWGPQRWSQDRCRDGDLRDDLPFLGDRRVGVAQIIKFYISGPEFSCFCLFTAVAHIFWPCESTCVVVGDPPRCVCVRVYTFLWCMCVWKPEVTLGCHKLSTMFSGKVSTWPEIPLAGWLSREHTGHLPVSTSQGCGYRHVLPNLVFRIFVCLFFLQYIVLGIELGTSCLNTSPTVSLVPTSAFLHSFRI